MAPNPSSGSPRWFQLLCTSNPFVHLSYYRAILIRVAIIGYAREPDYELQPPDAPSMNERIAHTMLHNQKFRDAFAAEGLDPGDRNLASFLREKEKERHSRSKRRRRSRSSKL